MRVQNAKYPDGSGRAGYTRREYDFERFVYGLDAPRVVVNTSWIDAPYGDDASPNPAKWSSGHFLGFLAERAGGPCWAENRGGNSLSDMKRCFRRLDAFGIERLSWAFVDQLYEGPESGYATIDDYERQIEASR